MKTTQGILRYNERVTRTMKHVPLWLLKTFAFYGFLLLSPMQNRRTKMQTMTHKPNTCVTLTVGQAATYLGLAVSTLNKWRCHGGGPVFIKMGRAVRYQIGDLDNYIKNQRMDSTSF